MSTTLEQIQYGFDRNSRRTWQRRSLTETQDQHYYYDTLGQVSAAARGSLNLNATAISGRPASAQGWDYDPTGNWRGYHAAANGTTTLDQHRVHDRGNRLTQIEGNPNNMILDRVGRMRQMAPDADGDWDGKLEITWDAWSRITRVKNNGEVVGDYAYDGSHRRITREADGETLHSYYNDAWRPVEERKDAETTAAMSYLWGARHRDDLVRRDRAVGGSTFNETRYILMDYFNPAAITDEAGEVKERYAFSAFGLRTILNPDFTVSSGSECVMEFAFQGQFLDAESGLMNYGYRYYSPQLGRWTCKDPIEERGGGNLYAFSKNDSTNHVDKFGLLTDLDYEVWDHALQQHAGLDWAIPGANMRPNGESLTVEATRILSSSQALSALSQEIQYACDRACGNDGEMFEYEGIKSGIQTDHILAIGKIGGEFHIWAQKTYAQSQCACDFKFLLLLLPDRFDFEYRGRGLAAESLVLTATIAQTVAGYRPFLIVPVGAIQYTGGKRNCGAFR